MPESGNARPLTRAEPVTIAYRNGMSALARVYSSPQTATSTGAGANTSDTATFFFDEVPDLLLEEEVCDHDRETSIQTFTEAVEMVANNP